MSKINNDDLLAAQSDFQSLLETVRLNEGHMGASSATPGEIARELEKMGQTRIKLGHPRDNLVLLEPSLFKAVGVQLDPIQKKKQKNENFYYMTVAVSMVPGDGVFYDQLKCELEFGPEGDDSPIIHSIFPSPEWKEVLKWGAELNLSLNADLSWAIGLDLDDPTQISLFNALPKEIQAKVKNKNTYKGLIVIPSFSYSLGRAEITATGDGNTFGYWDIQKPELQQTQTVKFGLIFKAPKTVTQVTLKGKAVARVSRNWLVGNLKPLLSSLTEPQKKQVANGYPAGDYFDVTLKLPV